MYGKRREFLKGAVMVVGTGLVVPGEVMAAVWPADLFHDTHLEQVLIGLGDSKPVISDKIAIHAPDIAENGAVVPVTIVADIPHASRISILTPQNPFVLNSSYELPEGTLPYVSTRIKLAKTMSILAVVHTQNGQSYMATRKIKVTIGGCGG